MIHAQNDLVRRQAARRIDRPPELAVHRVADTFEHAPHQPLRQDRVALWFRVWVLLVGHGSEYEPGYLYVQVASAQITVNHFRRNGWIFVREQSFWWWYSLTPSPFGRGLG